MPPLREPVGRPFFASHGHVDKEISARHFQLSRRGPVHDIQDLGSVNGTWLDGHRLPSHEPAPLKDGAVLRLGKSLFLFREAHPGPLDPDPPRDGLVGPWGLRPVREALDRIRRLRPRAVLIEGATGTGKELVARAVASALGRDKPYGAVNMAALPRDMLDGHLFGWTRGAFTGADRTDPGLIRAHEKGAVFLDEIGELPLALQAKLLRVLENQEVLSIGQHHPSKVDVAFLAATNKDLRHEVQEGTFRADLLARFPVRVTIPKLADRPEDLVAILLARRAMHIESPLPAGGLGHVEAIERLLRYDWPANVRDVDRLVVDVLGERPMLEEAAVRRWLGPAAAGDVPPEPLTTDAVTRALTAHRGNRTHAAEALGVSRGVLNRWLDKHPELKEVGAEGRSHKA